MSKYKIIALMGQAGAGKDTILRRLIELEPDFHEVVSCTTRPMREGEVDGVNYHFLTGEQFADRVLMGEMLECCEFNEWFYGTGYESLRSDCINVGVFNPTGVESLLAHKDVDVQVFYVTASDKTRMLRQLNREENPDVHEIVRRFKADWMDFSDLDFDYIEIDNEKNVTKACLDILANIK